MSIPNIFSIFNFIITTMYKIPILFILISILSCVQQPEPNFPTYLGQVPSDPLNSITPNKVKAGKFFFESKLISVDGRTACINCHDPKRAMTSPFEHVPGGVGLGGIVTLTQEGFLVGVIDPNYHGQMDSMIIKSWGSVGAAYNDILGHSGRFGLYGKTEDEYNLTLGHFNLPEGYPKFKGTLHQANMALGGHELLVKKRLLSDEDCLDMLEYIGVTVTEDTSADTLKLVIAETLDAYQRTFIPSQSRYGTGRLSKRELNGYALVKHNCGSCHSNEVFAGGLEESFQADFNIENDFGKVDPSCYEDVFGVAYLGDSTIRRMTKPLASNLKDHFSYGVVGQYSTFDAYMEDKYRWLYSNTGKALNEREREDIKLFILDGLHDPDIENAWQRFIK